MFDAAASRSVAAQEKGRCDDVDGESRPRVRSAKSSEARALASQAVLELLVELRPRKQKVEKAAHGV
jgi:hypothetical protein